MVDELDITDQDVLKIADMIDGEITTLVPEWKRGPGIEESSHCTHASFCHNCASRGYLLDYVSSNSPGAQNLQVLQCSKHGCATVHGRFEEITYQVEGPERCADEDCAPVTSRQTNGVNYTDIWAQRDAPESSSRGSREIHCDEGNGTMDPSILVKEERIINMDRLSEYIARNSISSSPSVARAYWDDYENEIRQELRWLKAKYQMQLREFKDQQLGVKLKSSSLNPDSDNVEHKKDNGVSLPLILPKAKRDKKEPANKTHSSGKHFASYLRNNAENRCANSASEKVQHYQELNESYRPEQIVTAKSFYTGALLPHTLHRATSLPVDAVDV